LSPERDEQLILSPHCVRDLKLDIVQTSRHLLLQFEIIYATGPMSLGEKKKCKDWWPKED